MLGASSLFLGAVLGVVWQPGRRFSAAIMAFGSGTLISAIAFEIALPAYRISGVLPLLVGFSLGGTLFTLATRYVDSLGGFLRNPASRRRFLFLHRQEEAEAALKKLSHIEVMQRIPPGEAQAIVSLLKPMLVSAGEVLCREGEAGDWLGMIVNGEAEVIKGGTPVAKLGPGAVFGEMALLTDDKRSASIVAVTDMDLYRLDRSHFEDLMTRSPHLAGALSRVLANRLRVTTDSRVRAEASLAAWRRKAVDSVELDLSPAEEERLMRDLAPRSAPMAIWVGTMVDNIPEAVVIGMTAAQTAHSGTAFLLAVFISNLPEALSSSLGMREASYSIPQVLMLWGSQILLCGLFATLGSTFQAHSSEAILATMQAISGGAVLAMLASTMMPEAYELGGATVSLATIFGFLTSFFISASQL
jgi:CRP-like cAMP-binding protein